MSLQQAIINVSECIGCTKCLDVCPTDAIIGAQKLLHSVIEEDCIGCERCVPVCPVDCIELHPMAAQYNPECLSDEEKTARIVYIRELAQAHKQRMTQTHQLEQKEFELSKTESEKRRAYLAALFGKSKL
jgi:Na+-translocating ferredoxin:NAD+ oxidoreductase subunit B